MSLNDFHFFITQAFSKHIIVEIMVQLTTLGQIDFLGKFTNQGSQLWTISLTAAAHLVMVNLCLQASAQIRDHSEHDTLHARG